MQNANANRVTGGYLDDTVESETDENNQRQNLNAERRTRVLRHD